MVAGTAQTVIADGSMKLGFSTIEHFPTPVVLFEMIFLGSCTSGFEFLKSLEPAGKSVEASHFHKSKSFAHQLDFPP